MNEQFTTAGRIVVGIDGSTQSQVAIEWAARRAIRDGVGLTLVLALAPLQVPNRTSVFRVLHQGIDFLAEVEKAGRKRLAVAEQETHARWPELDLQAVLLRETEPSVALVGASADAHLVVTGTRGLGAVRGAALGSVSSHLVAHARGRVVIVPETGASDPATPGLVVVGVDDAAQSAATLDAALEEAARANGRVLAIHAWEYTPSSFVGVPEIDLGAFDDTRELLTAALDRFVGEHNSTVPVETRVEVGSAGAALVEASHEAELVVVGTRGRSGLSGLLLGSTCREVVRRALCPVLVVPAPRT